MTQLLDHAALNELREALGEELDGIVELYVTGLKEQAQALADLFNAQDLPALRRSAHSLKGSSVSMGAMALGALAAQIEHLAAAGQPGGELQAAMAQVVDLADATATAFRDSGWVRS